MAAAAKKAAGRGRVSRVSKQKDLALDETTIQEIVDGRRKYPPGLSRKQRRELRALRKKAGKGVDVSRAEALVMGSEEEDKRTDAEILEDMKRRFRVYRRFIQKAILGKVRSVIVPGAPGIGKSYIADEEVELLQPQYRRVSGAVTGIELYKLAWEMRDGGIIIIDDGDKVFKNEETLNILKHLTDTRKHRILSFRSNSEFLMLEDGTEVEREFEFNGAVIMLSNKDFQREIDQQRGKNWEHMEALVSRGYLLDLRVHSRREISIWIKYVVWEGEMFKKENITDELGHIIVDWLEKNRNKLREYSLRTVKKLCDLVRHANGWTPEVVEDAESTLLR